MDIYDSVALRRPTAFALNLKRLPTELVHQVTDELPLVRILQILAHKEPHLNRCIISHKLWGKLFTKQEDIDKVIDLFILYSEICRFTAAPIVWPNSLLGLGAKSPRFGREVGSTHLKVHLEEAIKSALPWNKREMALLETHATSSYPGHDADLALRWNWVKEAKRNLNRAKSRQLTIGADLMSQYPEKLQLKKPLDPSQGRPRKNLKHIEDGLRVLAKQVLQHPRLLYSDVNYPRNCKLAADNIELVPYDRYLWFFIDVLKDHPIAEDREVDELIANLAIDTKFTSPEVTVSEYPQEILAEIVLVLKGLAMVYTGSPRLVVPRINWEGRKSATGLGSTKPAFCHDTERHSDNLPIELHRCGVSGIMTYDEREYEWLRSFLKVVTWMEQKFGGVEVPTEIQDDAHIAIPSSKKGK